MALTATLPLHYPEDPEVFVPMLFIVSLLTTISLQPDEDIWVTLALAILWPFYTGTIVFLLYS
jgi:hypothetical protein